MRCNVGVDPDLLVDQHLIAEYRELPMLIGSLRFHGWEIKSPVLEEFNLGTGHMNFLKVRLRYIQRRHVYVKEEMVRRGFKCDALNINLEYIPEQFCNDWTPSIFDSMKIRRRLSEKLLNYEVPWRYKRRNLDPSQIHERIFLIDSSSLFVV
jgi:deoxyribonuclease (pyrimidine dimer)